MSLGLCLGMNRSSSSPGRRVRRVASAMALVIAASAAGAQPDATTREIARYVDDSTLALIRVDLRALNVAPLLAELRRSKPEAVNPEAEAAFAGWRDGFLGAGGTEIAIIVTLKAFSEEPMFMVAPLSDPTRGADLAAFLAQAGPGLDFAEARGAAVVAGERSMLEGLPFREPTRLGEIERAQSLVGEAPVKVLLIPSDFARRAVDELIPALPPAMGSVPIATLTSGIQSAAIGAATGTSPSLRLVFQSKDAQAAAALAPVISSLVKSAAESAPAGPVREAIAGIAGQLNPQAMGDRVSCELDSQGVFAMIRAIAPALAGARSNAKEVIVMSQVRNAVMSCMVYASDHKDQFPASLDELSKLGFLEPASAMSRGGQPLVYLRPSGGTFASVADPSRTVLVHEPIEPWLGSIAVGFVDGHVELINDRAQAEKLIAASKK